MILFNFIPQPSIPVHASVWIRIQEFADSKITDFCAVVIVHENVVWLQVTMQTILTVQVLHATNNVDADSDQMPHHDFGHCLEYSWSILSLNSHFSCLILIRKA